MKRFHTRWAIVLTGAAVLIPVRRLVLHGRPPAGPRGRQLLEVARREAHPPAERMASHLAIRLEELNDHESNRPYVHYWREYVSRGEACADPGAAGRRWPGASATS